MIVADTDRRLVYENLQIYPMSRTVYINSQEIILTRMEFDVLYYLASNPNRSWG